MGLLTVKYDDGGPVQGAQVHIKDSSTGRDALYGTTNGKGELWVIPPPPWYTHGTYSMVIDAGNTRVGQFWGYVLGFMTPEYLTVSITRIDADPIIGPIDYPIYHKDEDPWVMPGWVIFGAVIVVVLGTGFLIFDYVEDWLQRRMK